MKRTSPDLAALLLLALVGLPLLLLAIAADILARSLKSLRPERTSMSAEPFDGHPPQGVVYECRKPGCTLHHPAQVHAFAQVESTVEYYCTQGHQAIARFPAADDATWPPDEQCRDS